MKISIITPTHNKADLLERTLRSVGGLDYSPADFEMIVVDDGSTDRTGKLLAAHRPPHGFKTVTLEDNRGRSRARNQGLEQAEGELVVFLDDDMELVPGFLRAHADFHREHPRAVGVGNVVNHPEVTRAPIDRYMSPSGLSPGRGRSTSIPIPWRRSWRRRRSAAGRRCPICSGSTRKPGVPWGSTGSSRPGPAIPPRST